MHNTVRFCAMVQIIFVPKQDYEERISLKYVRNYSIMIKKNLFRLFSTVEKQCPESYLVEPYIKISKTTGANGAARSKKGELIYTSHPTSE